LQISDRAQELAAQLSAGSGFDGSFVRLNILRKNIDAGLELMADIALNPAFAEEEIDRQRKNYVGRLQSTEKDPAARSRRALMKALYGTDHPYGKLMWSPVGGGATYFGLGSKESVESLTREQLVDFYKKHYRPNNSSLVFAGNISLEEATSKAKEFFGKWKPGNVPDSKIYEAEQVSGNRIIIVDKPDAPQSMIVAGSLGMRHADDDFPAMQLVQVVLGGSFQRLDKNLREDKGYTYGAGFSLWSDRQRGPMYVIAPVQTQSTKESIQEILLELRDISGGRPIDGDELGSASATLVKQFPSFFESVGGIAAQLEQVVLQDLGDQAWADQLATWNSLALDQVNEAASSRIRPDSVVFVIVGDRAKIESGIRDLELGEVEVIAADS
jgi:zinc protease